MLTTVALAVYKEDGLAEDRFVLHSFSSLQNNQKASAQSLVHRGDSSFESLVYVLLPLVPGYHLSSENPFVQVFYNP